MQGAIHASNAADACRLPHVIGRWMGVAGMVALAGCGNPTRTETDAGAVLDAAPPRTAHGRLSWQVRCDAMPGCMGLAARSIDADDGEGGHRIACDVRELGDGTRRLAFSLADAAGHGLAVSGGIIPMDGGRLADAGCELTATEPDDFDLRGACGPNPPSEVTPCHVQRVDLDDSSGTPTLRAELRCVGLRGERSMGTERELTAVEAASAYAVLEMTGCEGL